MASLRSELYESARRTYAPVLAILGLLLALAPFWTSPEDTIQTRWVLLLGTAAVVTGITLLDVAVRMHRRVRFPLPSVMAAHSSARNGMKNVVLLLDPSEMFGHGFEVSIYSRVQNFEVMIGLGHVSTIQSDGSIQVQVTNRVTVYSEVWDAVEANNKQALEALIVKPSIPVGMRPLEENP